MRVSVAGNEQSLQRLLESLNQASNDLLPRKQSLQCIAPVISNLSMRLGIQANTVMSDWPDLEFQNIFLSLAVFFLQNPIPQYYLLTPDL